MLPLRALFRSVPRSAAQLSCRTCLRKLPYVQPLAAYSQPRWQHVSARASFHSSTGRRSDTQELVAKLQSEYDVESDQRDADYQEPRVQEYLSNSPFEVHEERGKQEIVLTRKYNDETITITVSIADLANVDDADELDDAYGDFEDEDSRLSGDVLGQQQSGGANTKGAVNQGRTSGGNIKVAPEDEVAPADREELVDDDFSDATPPNFDIHAAITIARPNKGALAVEAIAKDGTFVVMSVNYFPTAELADPKTHDQQVEQQNLYGGPPFGNLDEDLQRLIETYLEDRGIDTSLALFLPEFIDQKEQKEYLAWLQNVKSFVE